MFSLVEILLEIYLGFIVSYLAFLSILALLPTKRSVVVPQRLRKFAIIIPAHNEALSIEKTINSILEAEYPRSLFDVIVVADNCSDETGSIAERASAIVYGRTDGTRKGKGYALQWGFNNALRSSAQYDAFIVVDADSVLSRNALWTLNGYLDQGHQSIQIADIVAPNIGAWTSEVSRVALTLFNVVRPLGRKMIECSAGLRGNGMCFSRATLERIPWQAHSLTEDLEYGLILLLKGVPTIFCPETSVVATMPAVPKNAESQRTRWEAGRVPVLRKYVPLLFKAILYRPSWQLADALIDLLTPAFVNIVGLILAVLVVKLLLLSAGVPDAMAYFNFWCLLLTLCGIYVFGGLIAADADVFLFKATLYLPRYIFWKINLYAKLLLKGVTKDWIRTTREVDMLRR
ncbi:MAG TPA: glycosyltransferase family 2 protein [Bacteroidota bacterium]|nr:glycosyltransferase family 2 protein [Bacteroidota bacterium]